MKYKAIALVGLVLSCFSCNDAPYSPELDGQAFIAQTNTKANCTSTLVVADGEEVKAELNVRLSSRLDHDTKYKLTLSEDVLKAYNERNNASYKMLPKELLTLLSEELVVKNGEVVSSPFKMKVKALTSAMKDSGEKFAIPFKMTSDDNCGIIPGADEFVYLVKPVIIASVPVLGTDPATGTYIQAKALGAKKVVLNAWTVEFNVNMSGFGKNNQALFGNWCNGSEIYIRFGDASTPFESLQCKWGSGQFDRSNALFVPNTWYHIALTYDGTKITLYINGQKDLETDKPAGTVFNFGDDIWVASSGSTWFVNGVMMNEIRVWDIARTQSQIQENSWSVSPKSKGLLHYWRMNEGQGNSFKNWVEGAPELITSDGVKDSKVTPTPRWLGNVRSDGKGRTNFDN